MNYRELFESDEVQKIAKSICDITRECWDLGLSDSTGFSISARVPGTNAILVDKSGTGFRRNRITPTDLILYDENGNLLYQPIGSDNPRLAPVNTVIHLAGYKSNSNLTGCIHWHDPYIIAFAGKGLPIEPYTLQSKLIGTVECIIVDDREEKKIFEESGVELSIPTGIHTRPDVLWVMQKVGEKAAEIITKKGAELEKHGIVISHFEHGLFGWGRSVEEAFENAYRARRNAQARLLSKLV
jgi:ribulose-5-phosphate 4-epimerase/fuculose-1-phosphate aldolase